MKIRELFLFGVLTLTSCISNIYIPERDKLREIESIPCNKKTMNCTHKSRMYNQFLKSKGYISHIVLGHLPTSKKGIDHTWVEVYNDKKKTWHMIDPTWRGSDLDGEGFPVNYYPDRKPYLVYENNKWEIIK